MMIYRGDEVLPMMGVPIAERLAQNAKTIVLPSYAVTNYIDRFFDRSAELEAPPSQIELSGLLDGRRFCSLKLYLHPLNDLLSRA